MNAQLSLLEPRRRFEELKRLGGPDWWERWHALPDQARPYDCRVVACPKCRARPGVKCRRPSGHSGPAVGAHAARWDMALAEAEARTLSNERNP